MATDNGMNAYLEAAFHGAKPVGGGEAPPVRLNRAILDRGKSAMRGGEMPALPRPGGGGGARGREGGIESAFDRNGDPAVTGDFERKGYPGTGLISNFLYGAGQLTDAGKRQQADAGILDKGIALYAQARAVGANDQQAAQHAVATLGAPLLMAMMKHPSAPLSSSAAIHRFLSGDSGARFAPDLKSGQQFQIDPQTGEVLGAKPIPGVAQPNPNFRPTGKTITDAQGHVQALGTDARGNLVYQPVMAAGQSAPAGQSPIAAGVPTLGPNGAPAAGPASPAGQLTVATKPAKPMTQQDRAEINNIAQVANALGVAKGALQSVGGLGETAIGRGLAEYVPGMGGTTAGQYATARDQLAASVAGALGGGSQRLKMQYAQMQEMLPGSFDSESAARRKLNGVQNVIRTGTAMLAQEYPQDPTIQNQAKALNAEPGYWLGGTDAQGNHVPGMQEKLQMLHNNPGALSNNDVAQIYAFESWDPGFHSRLADNDRNALADQMNRRGTWALRPAIVAQQPELAGSLPDGQTVNSRWSDEIKATAQSLGNRATPVAPLPMTPNPQGTQTPPPASSYSPASLETDQAERANAQQAQIVQTAAQAQQTAQLRQNPQIAAPETNSPAANASIQPVTQEMPANPQADRSIASPQSNASGPGFSLGTPAQAGEMTAQAQQEANAGRFPEATAQQPAGAAAAPSATTDQARAPNVQGSPNALPPATYKPVSQADALNYNELQQLRAQQGLSATAPVQWASGTGAGGASARSQAQARQSPNLSTGSGNVTVGGGGDNFGGGGDILQGNGFPNGQPDRSGFQTPNQMVKQDLFGSGGGGEDQVSTSMDPISLLRRVFGGGGGQQQQQAQPQGGQGDEQVTLPDVNVTAPAPQPTAQQQIPIPPPQPAAASGPSIDTLENAFGGLVGGE